MNSEVARIRLYRPADLGELYRVCVQTADNGRDATSLFRDPQLPGHVYAAPYVTFEPSLAFVVEDGHGVGGYVVAALDSQAFERRLERDWWPTLRASYPEPPQGLAAGLSEPERFAVHDIHHPWLTADDLAGSYPSHLHIDLLPRLQRRGIGRDLIMTAISRLRDQGSQGLHLLVGRGNVRAAGFYRHLGFSELPHAYLNLFTMDLSSRL